jgi:hypothetical protein
VQAYVCHVRWHSRPVAVQLQLRPANAPAYWVLPLLLLQQLDLQCPQPQVAPAATNNRPGTSAAASAGAAASAAGVVACHCNVGDITLLLRPYRPGTASALAAAAAAVAASGVPGGCCNGGGLPLTNTMLSPFSRIWSNLRYRCCCLRHHRVRVCVAGGPGCCRCCCSADCPCDCC